MGVPRHGSSEKTASNSFCGRINKITPSNHCNKIESALVSFQCFSQIRMQRIVNFKSIEFHPLKMKTTRLPPLQESIRKRTYSSSGIE